MSDAVRDLERRITEAETAGNANQATFLRGVLQLQIAADQDGPSQPPDRSVLDLGNALADELATIKAHIQRIGDQRGLR